MENKNRCMMCSYFKRTDKDLPDFGMCTKNDFEVVSSDLACCDFDYAAEQMAREKQKELEDKVEKYEKILCDIYSILHPYSAENKNISAEMAFIKLPDEVEAKAKACKDNFDECIRQMRIIDELKTENARLKETTAGNYKASIRKDELIKSLRDEKKAKDEEIKRLEASRDRLITTVSELVFENIVNKKTIVQLKEILEKEKAAGNSDLYQVNLYKSQRIMDLEKKIKEAEIEKYQYALGEKSEEMQRLQWRNDNQSRMIQDLKKERDEIDDKYGKLKFKFCDMLQEKGELEETNNRYYKDNERLAKKNHELQIRVNDLLFQEKLNKSAFGYDYEEENGKLRVENERLRNMVKSQRNCSQSYYSAMKAEDKIEHIQKEAKKWKNKYKEAYDILQEFFGEHSNIMSISYDISGDLLTLKLLYNDSAYTKHNRLEKARERMKKLD